MLRFFGSFGFALIAALAAGTGCIGGPQPDPPIGRDSDAGASSFDSGADSRRDGGPAGGGGDGGPAPDLDGGTMQAPDATPPSGDSGAPSDAAPSDAAPSDAALPDAALPDAALDAELVPSSPR